VGSYFPDHISSSRVYDFVVVIFDPGSQKNSIGTFETLIGAKGRGFDFPSQLTGKWIPNLYPTITGGIRG
jgi:hypothetical protein